MKPSSIIPGTATATLLLAATLTAQSIRTWDGDAATSSFLDAANWSDDTVPVAGDPARWRELIPTNPPVGTPEQCADLVAFLASDRASHIAGTVVTIDGGAAHYAGVL